MSPTLTQVTLSLFAISLATISVSLFQLWRFVATLRQRVNVRAFLL
ncbi:hypothetical protein [Spirosoma flavus]